MKKIIIILILILIASVSFGQNYKITDFQPDSLEIWQIYANGEVGTEIDKINEAYTKDNYKSFGFGLEPEITFNYSKIRNKSILYYSLRGSLYKTISNSKDHDIEHDNNRLYVDFSGTQYYRKYFYNNLGFDIDNNIIIRSRNNFRELDMEMNDDDVTYNSNDKSTDDQLSYDVTIKPGLVYGRIYDGQYSAKAMEIINEIRNAGFLKKELSKKQYLKLSQIILERKEALHYDSRIKKLEALKEIITYLKKIEAINTDEILSVLITEDIYSYDYFYNTIPRQNGFEIYSNLEVNYRNLNRDQLDDETIKIHNTETLESMHLEESYHDESTDTRMIKGINFGITHSKIYNWNLCQYINLNVRYLDQSEDSDLESKYSIHQYLPLDTTVTETEMRDDKTSRYSLTTSLESNFYYQIDSRSHISLRNSIHYNLQNTISEQYDDPKTKYTREYYYLSISPQYTYFLTPKLYLSGGYSYYWTKYWNNNNSVLKTGNTNQSHNFSVEFGYYL